MFRNSIAKSSISDANSFTRLRQMVVEIGRRNRHEQPGRRRDQRLRNAGADHREARRAHLSDRFERQQDPHHGPEQPDERRDAGGRGQERNPLLQLVHLDHRCAHQRAVDSRQALQSRTCGTGSWIGRISRHRLAVRRALPELRGELGVTRLEQTDQRALAERSAYGLDFGELVASAEDLEKTRRLPGRAGKRPGFVEDDAPGNDREEREDDQNALLNRTRLDDDLDQRPARAPRQSLSRHLLLQGKDERFQACANGPPKTCCCAAGTAPGGQNCIMLGNSCQTYARIGVLSLFRCSAFSGLNTSRSSIQSSSSSTPG